MLFNSLHFLLFFPAVFLLYYTIKPKYRWILLLGASFYFYMCWKPGYIVLILAATLINYLAALGIEKYRSNSRKKRMFLVIGVAASLGMLFFYKYIDFFSDFLNHFLHLIRIPVSLPALNILLPVGISFYTFQAMSYTIDVYHGSTDAEHSFAFFALYVSFFPQLVAGPIEKSENLLPQLHAEHSFRYQNVSYGIRLMAIGFFKKVVVADNIAPLVDSVFNNLSCYTGGILFLAAMLFAFQIYCDFSGYSDIARGCAKTLGIDLMINFRSPYLSGSVKEFWRRWHISLSSWFRDYVYIPLGGNRCRVSRVCFNMIITFLLSGIWHGANYTFILWGFIHGVLLVAEYLLGKIHQGNRIQVSYTDRLPILHSMGKAISILCTFLIISFTWIFFRANSLADLIYIFRNTGRGLSDFHTYLFTVFVNIKEAFGIIPFGLALFYILILTVLDAVNYKHDIILQVDHMPTVVRWTLYVLFIVLILLCMPKMQPAEFIYFQF